MAISWSDLPGRCFVSHSYQDGGVVTALKERLTSAQLDVFGRVDPDPRLAVSEGILARILSCEALVYLRGGASASSFWVAFERDYALRAGRPVYAWDPDTGELAQDHALPLDLDVRVVLHREDEARVGELLQWMKTERHVELERTTSRTSLGGVTGALQRELQDLLAHGGAMLWFASQGLAMPMASFALELAPDPEERIREKFDERRIYGANPPLADFLDEATADFFSVCDPYFYTSEVVARVDPGLPRSWRPPGGHPVLDLHPTGTSTFDQNRVDDLIIRVYAAVLDQRRRSLMSPPQTLAVLRDQLWDLVQFWRSDSDAPRHARIGDGARSGSERWWTSRWNGQVLFNACVREATQVLRREPSRMEPRPWGRDDCGVELLPSAALAWDMGQDVVELSLVVDGPFGLVFVRCFPLAELRPASGT